MMFFFFFSLSFIKHTRITNNYKKNANTSTHTSHRNSSNLMFTKQFVSFHWNVIIMYDHRFHLQCSSIRTKKKKNQNDKMCYQIRNLIFKNLFAHLNWFRNFEIILTRLVFVVGVVVIIFDGLFCLFVYLFVRQNYSVNVFISLPFFCEHEDNLARKYKSKLMAKKKWWKNKKITKITRTLLHTTTTKFFFCSSQVFNFPFSNILLLFILTLICSKFQT